MNKVVEYLTQLRNKPEYIEEYNRLKDILCEEDVKELYPGPDILCEDIKELYSGPRSKLIWNDFNLSTLETHLLVLSPMKLVSWDGKTLTEECGKTYTWTHNPYTLWAGLI